MCSIAGLVEVIPVSESVSFTGGMIWLRLPGGPHYETSSLMKQRRILGLGAAFCGNRDYGHDPSLALWALIHLAQATIDTVSSIDWMSAWALNGFWMY